MQKKQLDNLRSSKLGNPSPPPKFSGISDIRTIPDFWSHTDKKYLDYNALSRSAIADAKSLTEL